MNNEILIFITEIAIPLVCSGISMYVLPKINAFVTEKNLKEAVKIAVEGVEQYIGTTEGYTKREAVESYILSRFDIDDEDLQMLIESAVYELRNCNSDSNIYY